MLIWQGQYTEPVYETRKVGTSHDLWVSRSVLQSCSLEVNVFGGNMRNVLLHNYIKEN